MPHNKTCMISAFQYNIAGHIATGSVEHTQSNLQGWIPEEIRQISIKNTNLGLLLRSKEAGKSQKLMSLQVKLGGQNIVAALGPAVCEERSAIEEFWELW